MKGILILIFSALMMSCSDNPLIVDDQGAGVTYDEALKYLDKGDLDSAFISFNQVKEFFIREKDSVNIANCYIYMTSILHTKEDFYGAQENALEADRYLNKSDSTHFIYLSANYNLLGQATYRLNAFSKAIEFYDLAIYFSNDSLTRHVYLNNKARVYQKEERYGLAIELYDQILADSNVIGDIAYARALTNSTVAKWRKDKSYNAGNDLLKALNIRLSRNDRIGQNSSYAHLADYYTNTNRDSALFYARKRYSVAKDLSLSMDQIEASSKLIDLSPSDSVKHYFEIYKYLSDSIQQARSVAKNQFALIRYEVEKSKVDNLRLEKENAEKAGRLARQRTMTGGVSLLFVIALVGGSFYYKKRKERLELEAQDQIKASLLNTSRKVHDVVANGIYRVMSEIEYKEDMDREDILDKLEEMYHKSRDISYETEEHQESEQPYDKQLTVLLKSFASDVREVFIVGNELDIWINISETVKVQVFHVLQELMINMDKHSSAEKVILRFEKNVNYLIITYSDDGVGIKKDTLYGNGLTNTVSRMENVGGKIIFADELVSGLKVEITVPSL